MTQNDPDRLQAARAARQTKAEEQNRLEAERRDRRAAQIAWAKAACDKLNQLVNSIRGKVERADAFSSHLEGFYEEIDKLAKGRSLLEVTERAMEEANHIIRDAKELIDGDPYLDRVKEFVAAGNFPVYPDVLLAMRAVQQSVERFQERLKTQKTRTSGKLAEANTIRVALMHYSESESIPRVGQIKDELGLGISAAWFQGSAPSFEEKSFDINRLDRTNLELYFLEGDSNRADNE